MRAAHVTRADDSVDTALQVELRDTCELVWLRFEPGDGGQHWVVSGRGDATERCHDEVRWVYADGETALELVEYDRLTVQTERSVVLLALRGGKLVQAAEYVQRDPPCFMRCDPRQRPARHAVRAPNGKVKWSVKLKTVGLLKLPTLSGAVCS